VWDANHPDLTELGEPVAVTSGDGGGSSYLLPKKSDRKAP